MGALPTDLPDCGNHPGPQSCHLAALSLHVTAWKSARWSTQPVQTSQDFISGSCTGLISRWQQHGNRKSLKGRALVATLDQTVRVEPLVKLACTHSLPPRVVSHIFLRAQALTVTKPQHELTEYLEIQDKSVSWLALNGRVKLFTKTLVFHCCHTHL